MFLDCIDINVLRAISALLLFLGFGLLCALVFSRPKKFYDEAALLPFSESEGVTREKTQHE